MANKYPQYVTNWHGQVLDNKIREHVKKGFYVRVIFNQYCIKYTVVIKELDDRKLLVHVAGDNHPERWQTCNVCDGPFFCDNLGSVNLIYSCDGVKEPECDFHCHEQCIKNITKEHKPCDCKLEHVSLSCGDVVVIDRDMISEICEDEYEEEVIKKYITEKMMLTGITCLKPDIFKIEDNNFIIKNDNETTIEEETDDEESSVEDGANGGESPIEDFPSALLLCAEGKLEEVQSLFEENPSIDFCCHKNYAFRHACANGHLNVAKWLLSICPDIDISSLYYYAFIKACVNGHLSVVEWLYENKEIQVLFEDDSIFLIMCEKGSNIEIAKWLYNKCPSEISYETFCITCFNNQYKESSEFEQIRAKNKCEIAKWLYSINPIDFKQDDCYLFKLVCCHYGYLDIAKWIHSIDRGVLQSLKFEIDDNLFIDCCISLETTDMAEWLLTEYPDFNKSVYKNIRYEDVGMSKWVDLIYKDGRDDEDE